MKILFFCLNNTVLPYKERREVMRVEIFIYITAAMLITIFINITAAGWLAIKMAEFMWEKVRRL